MMAHFEATTRNHTRRETTENKAETTMTNTQLPPKVTPDRGALPPRFELRFDPTTGRTFCLAPNLTLGQATAMAGGPRLSVAQFVRDTIRQSLILRELNP